MSLLVQKYGGSSVATTARILAVARRITAARRAGHAVVVVVSAMGGTTNELVRLARRIHDAPPARELDMLLTAGERVSMALLSMALDVCRQSAISLTGSQSGILTDARHADAKILHVRAERIREALDAGRIVIVAGFQGVSSEREVTTLGRGGSDITAVAIAAALGAERCEIYTDVDGVHSADPRVVPQAARIECLSYDEMLEIATRGARVLHSRAVEVARRFGVVLHVRSSFLSEPGTVIRDMEPIETMSLRSIVCDEDMVLFQCTGLPQETKTGARLLAALGAGGVRTKLVVHLPQEEGSELVLVVRMDDLGRAQAVLEPLLETLGGVLAIDSKVAAVTVVGSAVQDEPGTVGRVLETLAQASVPIRLVSTATLGVCCIVPRSEAERAVQRLHEALGLDTPKTAPPAG